MSIPKKCTKNKDNSPKKSYNVLVTYINSKECCPMKTTRHYSEEICKRLEAKKLTETIYKCTPFL